ncbi:MAG: hypothetical protein AABZ57_08100, partial [Candidatus Margulisiibacteriota bacterium]
GIGALINDLKDLNIKWPERFNYDDLKIILKNRKGRPENGLSTVILYPKADWNQAFTQQNEALHQLCAQKNKNGTEYIPLYFECNTDIELIDNLNMATQNGSKPAEQIIIGGHGSFGTDLSLGEPDKIKETASNPENYEQYNLDLGDITQLKNAHIEKCLRDKGTVVLITCSGAEGRSEKGNLPNEFKKQIFPNAKHIFAPDQLTNIKRFNFDGNGEMSSVDWVEYNQNQDPFGIRFSERDVNYDAANPSGAYKKSDFGIIIEKNLVENLRSFKKF